MHDLKKAMEISLTPPLPPGEHLPGGASRAAIDEAEARLGLTFPDALKDWLALCNGPCVGPGGVFGVRTAREFLDIEEVSSWFPTWRTRGWIPIAGDGSGNYYVLVPVEGKWPVCFVEASADSDAIAFVVASDLSLFLFALFQKEAGHDDGWPFDRATVVAVDPEIQVFRGCMPLPWEVQ